MFCPWKAKILDSCESKSGINMFNLTSLRRRFDHLTANDDGKL